MRKWHVPVRYVRTHTDGLTDGTTTTESDNRISSVDHARYVRYVDFQRCNQTRAPRFPKIVTFTRGLLFASHFFSAIDYVSYHTSYEFPTWVGVDAPWQILTAMPTVIATWLR